MKEIILIFSVFAIFGSTAYAQNNARLAKLNGEQLIDSLKSLPFASQIKELKEVILSDTLMENISLRKHKIDLHPHGNGIDCPFRPIIVIDTSMVINWNSFDDKSGLLTISSFIDIQEIESIEYLTPIVSAALYGKDGCSGAIEITTKKKRGNR